jgi:VanZ family protein
MQRIGAAGLDALGHLKHTRELFWHYWSPVLAMLALISLESTEVMSGTHTRAILARLMQWIGHPLSLQSLDLLNLVLRKAGHVVGYGLLCFSWLLLLRGTYRLWWRPVWAALALLCTVTVAVADELHQMRIPGRNGHLRDMLLDLSAALIAAALVWGRAQRRCRVTQAGQRAQEQSQRSS